MTHGVSNLRITFTRFFEYSEDMKAYGCVEVQLHLFLTAVLGGGGQLHAPASFSPREGPQLIIEKEAEWASEPLVTFLYSKHPGCVTERDDSQRHYPNIETCATKQYAPYLKQTLPHTQGYGYIILFQTPGLS
jgi:hypothetical protein